MGAAIAVCICLCSLLQSTAAFNISNAFSSSAVLQRDSPVVLWGAADSRATTVTTSAWLDGKSYAGDTDANLIWRVTLPAHPAWAKPFNLTIFSSDGGQIALDDLLVGDVILCSGQSNQGLPVNVLWNVSDVLAQAATLPPTLRLFQASGNQMSAVPYTYFDPREGFVPWQHVLAGGNKTLLDFGAACYIMGVTVLTEFVGGAVPIGLLHSAHGGTSLQAWQSPASVDTCGDTPNSWNSSVLYNSNLAPLIVGPMAIAGVYWYQGEEDTGIGWDTYYRSDWYACALRSFILDLRTLFNRPTLPFIVQQLHAWVHAGDTGLAVMRQAQTKALSLPNVGLAVAFDGGDPAAAMAGNPGGTVHPHCKYIPGRRAAATWAGMFLGLPVPFQCPLYADATAITKASPAGTHLAVTISFASGTTGSGLVLRGWEPDSNSSHCPTERHINVTSCDWFAIQASNGLWYNASVAVGADGHTLVLQADVPKGEFAMATRNGFSDWPVVTAYTAEGLPVLTWLKSIF